MVLRISERIRVSSLLITLQDGFSSEQIKSSQRYSGSIRGQDSKASARHIRRQWFVGVPRAVLEERMQRGLAARGAARSAVGPGFSDDDMRDFWAYQAHVRADAD